MKDEFFAYEMGVSYLLTEDYELAINSFREALSHRPDFMHAFHNLMYALQHQGTSTMKVLCPECKHWWDTDIFPNNTPGDIMQKTAVAAEFAEVPASTRTLDCPKCKKTIINTFFLCRTCFKGWKYYNISKIGERDGKQVWMPITIPCSECGAQLTKREYKTPQEIAIFDKLLAQRPEIASGLQYLRELEKQQEKKNRTP